MRVDGVTLAGLRSRILVEIEYFVMVQWSQ